MLYRFEVLGARNAYGYLPFVQMACSVAPLIHERTYEGTKML